jgi:hypothetical protein
MEVKEVKASTRKLRCEWTSEMAFDLKSMRGIDIFPDIKMQYRKDKIDKILNNF